MWDVLFSRRKGMGLWMLGSAGMLALFVGLSILRASPASDDQDKNQDNPKPKVSREEKRRQNALRKEMETPYKKWLEEEVPYIITPDERATFKKLSTDDERESFIENFWDRRNPNPGSPENEFKEEYYRRIAYANEHYASGIPGWRTDRGRIYIMYGPPTRSIPTPAAGRTSGRIRKVAARLPLIPSSIGGTGTSTASVRTSFWNLSIPL